MGGDYTLWSCGCGVVFSEPRVAPPADWYEKAAPLRAAEPRALPADDWRFATFLAEGLKPGRLLDAGCGDGGFLALAKAAGWAGVGFDYDARTVARARERGVEAYATEFEAFVRARSPGEFDALVLFDVLEHAPEPAALLDRLSPLLKSGGLLAVTLPNARRPLPFVREEHDHPPHHFTRWTPEAMRGFLARRGFGVVRQDAGALKVGYLSDHIYFYALMPFVLRLARRVLFGARSEGKTITQLYAESPAGALSDKGTRQRLVDGAKALLRLVTWPAALALWGWYRATRPLCGDCLYTLAVKKG
jgi:SAM-dependent methyltransferase